LIYRWIKSLGTRKEKREEKEERRKISLIKIIITTIIRPKNRIIIYRLAIC
jgi:hypothetical protein